MKSFSFHGLQYLTLHIIYECNCYIATLLYQYTYIINYITYFLRALIIPRDSNTVYDRHNSTSSICHVL